MPPYTPITALPWKAPLSCCTWNIWNLDQDRVRVGSKSGTEVGESDIHSKLPSCTHSPLSVAKEPSTWHCRNMPPLILAFHLENSSMRPRLYLEAL
jgi:hypothetical protein